MNDDRFVLKPTACLTVWVAALVFYAASFLLPSELGPGTRQVPGWALFWMGALFCWYPPCWPWWANVLFWLALGYSLEKPTATALVLAILAFLLAASFLFVAWPGALGPAYWTWAGSMGLLAFGVGVSLVPSAPPFREDEEWRDLDALAGPRPAPGDERLKQAR